MRAGTRIEVRGWGLDGREIWYPAKIGVVRRAMLPLPQGYHPVTYPDGGKLLSHENSFRVVDNRAVGQ
jgi:hypothetical protein